MKEQTYGWYPSAKNVYDERRMGALTPYQVEALYRYRDSKYYSEAVTPEPEIQQSPSRKSQHSRPSSTHSSNRSHQSHTRVRSAPLRTTYKPPPRLNIPTPAHCWSTHVPETEITIMPSSSPAPPAPPVPTERTITPPYERPETPPEPEEMPAHSGLPEKQLEKVVRIQSARMRRDSPSIPKRPVRSAGPVRPSPSPAPSPAPAQTPVPCHQIVWSYPQAPSPSPANGGATPEIRFSNSRASSAKYRSPVPPQQVEEPSARPLSVTSPMGRPPSGKRTPLRPKAPSPMKMEQAVHAHAQIDAELDRLETPEYEQETKKNGWMMEVHGDPLRLKKVSKRLSYTVRVAEPEVEQDPPGVHMENLETFFLNTIPRRPMAFAIDKEWISETIHKKRMEHQAKHGGLNYRYKNFSFVY